MKSPSEMSGGAINRELEALDKKRGALTDKFIAAGRGYETPSETDKLFDPLAMKYKELASRHFDLLWEVKRRAGPGMYRLPNGGRGFGPIRGY
jgi:hypothetical protein